MNYFIVFSTEDDHGIHGPLSKEEAKKRLEERYYGNIPILDYMPSGPFECTLGLVVIKGELIIPQPIVVATKYEL